MKIAVIGANGQLGSDICLAFKNNKDEVIELNHEGFDIGDEISSMQKLAEIKADLVINTAAFHHVDKCETEVKRAFEINAIAARNLAKASNEIGFRLFHISTDYVFDGSKQAPYVENDAVCPVNVYGNSKAAGEFFVRTISKNSLVIRVSGIYGKNPCRAKGGVNFVNLMIKLGNEKPEVRVVNNEFVSPTSTVEIARQLIPISRSKLQGICHSTAEGSCSWYEFAKEIFSQKNISTPLNIAQPGEFPINTPRPFYSVLENAVLKKEGIHTMKHWKDALTEYLNSPV